MIKLNSANKLSSNSSSLMVSYLRPVQISFGNYPYIEDLHNFMTIIKNNLLDNADFPWSYISDVSKKDNTHQRRPGFKHIFKFIESFNRISCC